MAYKTSEVLCFKKKSKLLLNFALFSFFVYLLPSLIKERLHTTLSVFEEGTIVHIFEGQNRALRLRQRFQASFN